MQIYYEKKNSNLTIIEGGLTLIINAIVLLLASKVFNGFYISSFWYALLTALVIMLLNKTIKPLIKVLTLPLTVFTLGLFYPFVNVIILKLAGLIMGSKFVIDGWFTPFFIAIFISLMTIILDILVTKRVLGGMR